MRRISLHFLFEKQPRDLIGRQRLFAGQDILPAGPFEHFHEIPWQTHRQNVFSALPALPLVFFLLRLSFRSLIFVSRSAAIQRSATRSVLSLVSSSARDVFSHDRPCTCSAALVFFDPPLRVAL